MSWQNFDLSNINPQLETVPEKVFTFELLPGARYSERDPEKIEAQVAIVNDGEFTGRRLYATYTREQEKALKRLEVAMGVDAEAGEDPVTYLNRAAGSRFQTGVKHSKATEQYPNPKAFLQTWNVTPAS